MQAILMKFSLAEETLKTHLGYILKYSYGKISYKNIDIGDEICEILRIFSEKLSSRDGEKNIIVF